MECGNEQLETYLEATATQRVHIRDIDLYLDLSPGERIQTEISVKFRRERVESELSQSGFKLIEWWTDEWKDFSLALARRE